MGIYGGVGDKMLSDTLFEAIQEIEYYQKEYPEIYGEIQEHIDWIKETMKDLQQKIDNPDYVFKKDKCIVKECSNHKDEGAFKGDICLPCFTAITTGVVGPTTSFLGELKRENFELKEKENLRLKEEKSHKQWRLWLGPHELEFIDINADTCKLQIDAEHETFIGNVVLEKKGCEVARFSQLAKIYGYHLIGT